MSATEERRWASLGARPTVNKVETYRSSLGRTVTQHHRGYEGVVVRSGGTVERASGTKRLPPEYEKCGHFHQKQGAAKKCAEATARRLNKQEVH